MRSAFLFGDSHAYRASMHAHQDDTLSFVAAVCCDFAVVFVVNVGTQCRILQIVPSQRIFSQHCPSIWARIPLSEGLSHSFIFALRYIRHFTATPPFENAVPFTAIRHCDFTRRLDHVQY